MSGDRAYRICPACKKEKKTTRTGVMGTHRMWDGKKMVPCQGSLKPPGKPLPRVKKGTVYLL